MLGLPVEEEEFKQSDPGLARRKIVVLVSPDNSISKWHDVLALNPLFTDGNDCFIKHVQNQFLYTQAGHTSSLLPGIPAVPLVFNGLKVLIV